MFILSLISQTFFLSSQPSSLQRRIALPPLMSCIFLSRWPPCPGTLLTLYLSMPLCSTVTKTASFLKSSFGRCATILHELISPPCPLLVFDCFSPDFDSSISVCSQRFNCQLPCYVSIHLQPHVKLILKCSLEDQLLHGTSGLYIHLSARPISLEVIQASWIPTSKNQPPVHISRKKKQFPKIYAPQCS